MIQVSVVLRHRACHTIYRDDVMLAAVPFIGCAIEYQDGWGLGTVYLVYITRESIEVQLTERFNDEEFEQLKALGWK